MESSETKVNSSSPTMATLANVGPTTTSNSNNQTNELEISAQTYNHQCYICDKIFSANSNLNRHLRKIHKENVQSPYNNVKCALCDSVYSSSSIYNQHLENDHKVKIEVENLTFLNKQTFDDWKHRIENETTSQYIKSRGEKKSKNVNKTYYSCNRSGYYNSKARTGKALKKQGTRKIGGRCPASMNVTLNPDSTYDVRFVKTHVGHSFELKHLDLSDKDRELIVQKLASGVTKKDIIKQLRSAIEQQQTTTTITTNNLQCHASSNTSSNHSCSTSPAPALLNNIEIVTATSEVVISNCPLNNNNHEISVTTSINNSDTSLSGPITPTNAASCQLVNANLLNTSFSSQPTSRLYLTTTKDIHNIINSKHLDSKLIRHNYDLNNVEAWIQEMKEFNEKTSVLLYKSQGELIDSFPKLREDDFLLVIMKDGQAEKLKNFGHKCIIIDSTHSVHCEYLQVTLISVIDDDHAQKGFPVGFMFSTRTDIEVLDAFFSIIKSKVGTIATRMFIADELDDFYQAWTNVMTRPTHNLLTPWSVFETWAKKFDLISNREKLRKLKKHLRSLLSEADSDKFNKLMTQIVVEYKADDEVKAFVQYFEEKFAKNPDLWSSCLRKTNGASTNQLWRLHDKFKAVYKEGKNSKKLCKYIASLMNLFEESQLDWLSKVENQMPDKYKSLTERHNKSIESGSLVYEVAVEPVYWLCPSENSNEFYYEVRHNHRPQVSSESMPNLENESKSSNKTSPSSRDSLQLPQPDVLMVVSEGGDAGSEPSSSKSEESERSNHARTSAVAKCCDLICLGCKSCRHEYKCTCLDYVVNLNMCKHVHRICTMCK